MRLEAVHRAEDHKAGCPTCGSAVHRRVFGEMHAGSFVLDGQRVEIRRVPKPEYRDPVYLDEITQYFDGGLYRLWPNDRYLSRGGKRLHRDVWVAAYGEIPSGCHVHHRDSNTLNNRLENLECLDASEHLAESRGKRKPLPTGGFFTHEARERATEWHKSPEGRLWHSRHAKRSKSWTKWKRESKPCEHCGEKFEALARKGGNAGKFCSTACKTGAYRERSAAQRNG
jgi:hypothetical protein